jgi:hypothetical protein
MRVSVHREQQAGVVTIVGVAVAVAVAVVVAAGVAPGPLLWTTSVRGSLRSLSDVTPCVVLVLVLSLVPLKLLAKEERLFSDNTNIGCFHHTKINILCRSPSHNYCIWYIIKIEVSF